jgi:hypothetical protein
LTTTSATKRGLKDMDQILKNLEGKNLTKKKLFDFLANLDFESIIGKKEEPAPAPASIPLKPLESTDEVEIFRIGAVIPSIKKKRGRPKCPPKEPKEIKCEACKEVFTMPYSLKRHYSRSPECVHLLSLEKKPEEGDLPKGIHLLVDEMLRKSLGTNDENKCRFCNSSFSCRSNFNKHFNVSAVCNRLSFMEFKQMVNSI